jgi:hypothetical protein
MLLFGFEAWRKAAARGEPPDGTHPRHSLRTRSASGGIQSSDTRINGGVARQRTFPPSSRNGEVR